MMAVPLIMALTIVGVQKTGTRDGVKEVEGGGQREGGRTKESKRERGVQKKGGR